MKEKSLEISSNCVIQKRIKGSRETYRRFFRVIIFNNWFGKISMCLHAWRKEAEQREKETTTNKLYWFGVVVNIKIILQSWAKKYISIIGPITLSIISDQNFICEYFIAITMRGWRSAKLEGKKRLSDFFSVLIFPFAAFGSGDNWQRGLWTNEY